MRGLAAIAALTLTACPSLARLPKALEPLPSAAEGMRIKTNDGWELVLIRYRPSVPAQGLPVLLVHGIGANGRNMDLDASHSLARWLAERGRESFVLDLRGAGHSDAPAPQRGRPFGYTMDTHASEDLPAALAAIREVTGSPRVDYIGHSMGGLVGYIYLARGGQGLNAVVTMGSPVRLNWGGHTEWLVRAAAPLVGPLKKLPMTVLAEASYATYWQINPPIDLVLYNPENIEPETWDKLMAVGASNIYGGVIRQFATWVKRGTMVSDDGAIDYLERLAKRREPPLLVVAGKVDHLAPVQSVRAGFDVYGGQKDFFVAGEENGLEHDYGHMDLVIGDRAPRELFPRLLRFLDGHAPAGKGEGR